MSYWWRQERCVLCEEHFIASWTSNWCSDANKENTVGVIKERSESISHGFLQASSRCFKGLLWALLMLLVYLRVCFYFALKVFVLLLFLSFLRVTI